MSQKHLAWVNEKESEIQFWEESQVNFWREKRLFCQLRVDGCKGNILSIPAHEFLVSSCCKTNATSLKLVCL